MEISQLSFSVFGLGGWFVLIRGRLGGMMCDANWLEGSWCGVEYVWGKGQGKKGLRRCCDGGERVETMWLWW